MSNSLNISEKKRYNPFIIKGLSYTPHELCKKSLDKTIQDIARKHLSATKSKDYEAKRIPLSEINLDPKNGLLNQSYLINKVSSYFSKAGLKDVERLIISNSFIYKSFLSHAILDKKIIDTEGVIFLIKEQLEKTKDNFFKHLINTVLLYTNTNIDPKIVNSVVIDQDVTNISLKKPINAIKEFVSQYSKDGGLLTYLDKFIGRGEIKESAITSEVKEEMLKYLHTLNLNTEKLAEADSLSKDWFDEYFSAAYIHALGVQCGQNDPLSNIYGDGQSSWDYSVDYFESFEEQGIIKENIKATGALHYVYELGENLGIFKLTDALVLKWSYGEIKLTQGNAASNLYRYFKKRDERLSAEERAMVYKQILNKGQGEVLSNMAINEEFPIIWEKMLGEVVKYIQKEETLDSTENLISKSGIEQATRDIQYNLTNAMVGKPLMDVHEIYAQLKECIEILGDQEIIDQMTGGSYKTFWNVIETLYKDTYGTSPNISAIKTCAIEGHKLFNWISDFDQNSTNSDGFRDFLASAESYILAADQVQSEIPSSNDDFNSDIDEDEEEFNNWD